MGALTARFDGDAFAGSARAGDLRDGRRSGPRGVRRHPAAPWSAAARTSLKSACRSPIRSPTARSIQRAIGARRSRRAAHWTVRSIDRGRRAATCPRRSCSSPTSIRCCGWGRRRSSRDAPRPAWTACSCSTCRLRNRPGCATRSARAASIRSSWSAPRRRTARLAEAGRAGPRIPVRHLATGCDRRAPRRRGDCGAAGRPLRRHAALPVALGFGVSQPEHVAELARTPMRRWWAAPSWR